LQTARGLENFHISGVQTRLYPDLIKALAIDAAAAAGAKGIVVAGAGNGNMTAAVDTLAKHAKAGIVCVRASRVVTGRVGRNVEVDDDKLGLVASLDLNPQKARVLLRLALLKTRTNADLQRLFEEY
jgi:L-asparaginase